MKRWLTAIGLLVLSACGTPPTTSSEGTTSTTATSEGTTSTTERVATPQPGEASKHRCGADRIAAVQVVDGDGRVRWTEPLDTAPERQSQTSPLVDGSRVYTSQGALAAFDRQSGRPLWQVPVDGPVYSQWLLDDLVVAVTNTVGPNGKVVAIDAESGTVRWTYGIPGEGLLGEGELTDDGGVALLGADGTISVLDVADGHLRWSKRGIGRTNTESSGGFTAGAGSVVTARSGVITTLDTRDGSLRWKVTANQFASPLVAAGTVVARAGASPDPEPLAGYDLGDGHRRWQLPIESGAATVFPTTAGLAVSVREHIGHKLVFVDPADGAIRWEKKIEGGYPQSVVAAGDDLVIAEVGTGTSRPPRNPLVTRRLADGEVVSSLEVDGDTVAASDDGTVYATLFASGRGELLALRHGSIAWRTPLRALTDRPVVPLPGGGAVAQVADPQCATAL